MTRPGHYAALQVSRDAEPEVIEKAYRVLALKYHPDTSSAQHSERRMQLINEAYAVLRDPVKRRRYDESLAGSRGRQSGWDIFWDAGLVGLYREHRGSAGGT